MAPLRNRSGAASVKVLLKLRDHQVCRDRTGASRKGCNGQSGGGSLRVSNRQNAVYGRGLHNCHSDNLGASRVPACYSVGKILAIQRQNQLSRLGDAHLEQHLVGANIRQRKGIRSGPGDSGSAVGAVLGEADIRAGSDGSSIIRRHQCIEIGITQNASGRALRACRTGFPGGTLGTYGTGNACGSLGTCHSCRALRTGGAGFSRQTLGADGSRYTRGALGTCHSGGTLRSGRTSLTCGALGAYRTGLSGGTLGTNRTGNSRGTLRSGRSGDSRGALGTDGTRLAYGPLGTDRASHTCGTLRSGRARRSGRTLRPHRARFSRWSLGTYRPCCSLGALGTDGTSCPRNSLGTGRTSRSHRSLRTLGPRDSAASGFIGIATTSAVPGLIAFKRMVVELRFTVSVIKAVVSVQYAPSLFWFLLSQDSPRVLYA